MACEEAAYSRLLVLVRYGARGIDIGGIGGFRAVNADAFLGLMWSPSSFTPMPLSRSVFLPLLLHTLGIDHSVPLVVTVSPRNCLSS